MPHPSSTTTAPDILYVITDLQVGGVPLHLHRLACAMRDRGLGVVVVSLARGGPVADMLRQDGIDVLSCEACCGWDVRVIGRLARILADVRPRMVHSLLFHANLAARIAAARVDFPSDRVLCEIQTVEVERRWQLWVDRLTYDRCRLTIGNSPSVIEHLANAARIPRDRLHLVRGGIDPDRVRSAVPVDRAALGLPAAAPIVVWVGRLDPIKGLDVLVRAFRRVADETDAHLLLVGDGPLRRQVKRWIGDLGLQHVVHLLGRRGDVASLLSAANLFVFPSRTEGLPNALLEAMAACCPIVTTDVPGCRDLIEHERTGLRVPYGDTGRLAEAMLRLLQDRELGSRLAAGADEEVSRNWHVEKTHSAYARLYATLGVDGTMTDSH